MRTPMDDLKDKFQFERDQLQEKLGTLEVERGTLQDTLADEQKWETHPTARERLEGVSGEITGVRSEIDMKEQGIALAENAKQVLAQQEEGPRQAGHGSEVPANAAVEAFQERTEKGEVWREAVENVVKVEAPIAMTVALHDPQPQMFSSDHTPTVDPGIALAMGAFAVQHVVKQVVEGAKEIVEKDATEIKEQFDQELYKLSMTPEELSQIEAQSWADDKNLKEQGGSRVEVEQPPAEALLDKQLEEMKELKDDLQYQQQAAQKELETQGLEGKGKEAFERNEFEAAVQKTNDLFQVHDQERAELGGMNDAVAAQMQSARIEMTHELCAAEAERSVNNSGVLADNENLAHDYAEKRNPDPQALENYRTFLAESVTQEIATRTETLQEQNFPQVSREGPSTSMNGPEENSPPSPGGSSGPDSGPDRNDM